MRRRPASATLLKEGRDTLARQHRCLPTRVADGEDGKPSTFQV